MNPPMLQNRHIQRAIGATAEVFNAVIEEHIRKEAPSDFRRQIVRDTMIFSGFKTYHHLKETAEQVFAPDGRVKTWGEFLQDTQKINERYNKNWLRAEYQFATAAAQMADKWVDIEAQKERYDLLYSTAGDHLVRPDHAILEGVCLPVDDPAWDTIYPPNGWGCRCTVIQVRKGSRPHSDSSMAIEQMEEMTKGREEIFRFNPGKEKCLFPKKHPYYGEEGSKERKEIGNELLYKTERSPMGNEIKIHINADKTELQDNIKTAFVLVDNFPNLEIKIRKHVREHKVKNAEFLIDGDKADAKRVLSEDGITSGFRKAIKQEAKSIIIDYDLHKKDKVISFKKTAKEIKHRHKDFEDNRIKYVYVIHNSKVVRFDKTMINDIEKMIEEMRKKGL